MFFIVLFQLFLISFLTYKLFLKCEKRDARAPIDDLGVLWLASLCIYTTLPVISWLAQGASYSPLSGRLYELQPSVNEVIGLLNISIGYAIGLISVYFILPNFVGKPNYSIKPSIRTKLVFSALLIVLIAWGINFVINLTGIVRVAESYTDGYAAYSELPLPVRQIIKLFTAFSNVASLIILVYIFENWDKSKKYFLLYLLFTLSSFSLEGARTGLVINLLAIVICYHLYIRSIPTKKIFAWGLIGIFIFLLIGVVRSLSSISQLGQVGFEGVGVGEFDQLWANAIELLQVKQSKNIIIPFSIRFGEFFEFVPSQLLWFEKNSLSNWFLDVFHPKLKEAGGGYAFGVVSQSVIGGGVIEAIIRGVALGITFTLLMKWFRNNLRIWWKFVLHLYILIWVYQMVRNSNFALIGNIIQIVIPTFILINIIRFAISVDFKK